MVSFLKGRRREDDSVIAIDSSGRDITVALEALVARAETAANDLRSLGPTLERAAEIGALRERCAELEGQVEGLLRLGGQMALAEEQAERVIKTQAATEARIAPCRGGRRAAPGADECPQRQSGNRTAAPGAGRSPSLAFRAPSRLSAPMRTA